jgi:GNAT superfamily N-acetyltransferase
VAAADERPVAVLTGTKREDETLISRIGVRPGELRRGHGGHLVTSLSQKLAVLGPPRLIAEVPAELPGAVAFFERLGWRREASFRDWLRPAAAGAVEPVPEGLIAPATPDQLAAAGALEVPPGAAWVRTRRTLLNRRESLLGLAVASPDRIEAWVLYDLAGEPSPPGGEAAPLEVVGFGAADEDRRELLLGALLRHLISAAAGQALRLARLADGELPKPLLASLGFAPDREYHRLATEAKPL